MQPSSAESNELWYALEINPEPWAVGPLDLIRRGGKLAPTMGRNQQLDAYKQAVRDELETKYGDVPLLQPCYDLRFWFWRNRAEYQGLRKNSWKNEADATNMQKATEDALQGILIDNDRNVIKVKSDVVTQGPNVIGAVVIRVRWGLPRYSNDHASEIPRQIMSEVANFGTQSDYSARSNAWPPR